jgi:hypothetical protein
MELYPKLEATAPESAHVYRLKKITEIQNCIEQERDKRASLSKKYRRSVRIINSVDCVLVVTTMGLGASGVALLSTIIAAPVVIALEAVAFGAGALSIIGGQVTKKLALKAEKHGKIKTLADAKLNTINDHISKALTDDEISDQEFCMILSELEKFNNMKGEIIKGVNEVNRGREDVVKLFQNTFDQFFSKLEHKRKT